VLNPGEGLKQTATGIEPVTLAEAKEHMEVVGDDHNAKIARYLQAAREWWEKATRRQFINATWEWTLPAFPSGDKLTVPKPPLSSVTTVKYIDTAGVLQTLSDTVYDVDTHSDPGRIALAYQQQWPLTREDINAVIITFVAGYGTTAASVPPDDRHAILLLAGHWFANRESVSEGELKEIPFGLQTLLTGSRILEV
jgi:uncharacterized phiE125 gp8 family phage protein